MKQTSIIAIPFLLTFLVLYWRLYNSSLLAITPSKQLTHYAPCKTEVRTTAYDKPSIPIPSLPDFAAYEKNRMTSHYAFILRV